MKIHLRLSLGAIVLVATAACAARESGGSAAGPLERTATRALRAYLDCSYIHADAMASDRRPAPDVAEAVLAYCERQHKEYCAAARDYLTFVAPPAEKSLAHERAEARCAQIRDDTRGVLAERLLKQRALAAERLERAREAGEIPSARP